MKRPIPLYLVTAWLCLGMVFQLGSIGRLAARYQQAGEAIPPFVSLLPLPVLALAIWLVWGFVRLRPVARWLCVLFFACWAILVTWRLARLLFGADSFGHISIRGIIVVAVIWLAVFIPNCASVVYLITGRFREFARWYTEERRREGMQRYAQKQVEKGLGS